MPREKFEYHEHICDVITGLDAIYIYFNLKHLFPLQPVKNKKASEKRMIKVKEANPRKQSLCVACL